MNKILCVQATVDGQGSAYIVESTGCMDLSTLFDGAEIGDTYELKLIEMTQEEFDAMPEFGGF